MGGVLQERVEQVAALSKGDSIVAAEKGVKQIREGIVVKPFEKERTDPKVGRVILKYISDDYLLSKHADADTTDA
ncbi:MAG: hypothetical protein HC888_04025 [Candidatus Competibacteraceae bacterium]|nr:hypothetical protein [Candidatus Competibacteraceae bacterium]